MIFSRRALQHRLDTLRSVIGEDATAALAVRMNRPGKDRMATLWEVAILSGLASLGTLKNELPLDSGRRPDIAFGGSDVAFVADVTTVSDTGFDEQNPHDELGSLIEESKTRLGLKIGGVDLRVQSKNVRTARGTKVVLRLPDRKDLREFVRRQIEPQLRKQIEAGQETFELEIDDETAGLHLKIDPKKSPFSSMGYASYDVPTIKDRNPLYNALHAKAKQLRGAQGLVGIIVGDGDSQALAKQHIGWDAVSPSDIASEFLRQNTSIHFVFLITVREDGWGAGAARPIPKALSGQLITGKNTDVPPQLLEIFRQMLVAMPKPVMTPVNGALRAREDGYGLGFHGGYTVSDGYLKISVRAMLELLAGRCSVDEFNASHQWTTDATDAKPRLATNPFAQFTMNPFEKHLREGRLPSSIKLIHTDENESDDWIEIEFGPPDPAISPFR